ncbi:protein of unknown function [Vibrio tapetis subsp. tapetis]|uniref:Uncharacterized protein n=1 Tax=Vibrio tapetis subsp. tapetis TaxID=1671868 RepID=A0A2N8ZGD0_9VIBR|nr:protein of unknown function [Vibrio tapetis subsp. tapetis]
MLYISLINQGLFGETHKEFINIFIGLHNFGSRYNYWLLLLREA